MESNGKAQDMGGPAERPPTASHPAGGEKFPDEGDALEKKAQKP